MKGRARSQLGNHRRSVCPCLRLPRKSTHSIVIHHSNQGTALRVSSDIRGHARTAPAMLEYRVVSSGTSMGLDNSSTRRMLNDMEASNASAWC